MDKKIDIKELEIPNICFSIANEKTPNSDKYKQQRIERGFDDTELWNLDITFASFMKPRLEVLIDKFEQKDVNEEIIQDLKQVILSFDTIINKSVLIYEDDELKLINKGLDLFKKHLLGLWY